MATSLIFFLVVASALICDAKSVKVSDFGFDPVDSTRFLQAALDSGAKRVVVDKQFGPWVTRPLEGRSNQRVEIEEGVVIEAKKGAYLDIRDKMIYYEKCTNVTWVGLGKGATIRMNRRDYWKPPYVKSEWRHGLRFVDCSDVLIENLTVCETGGDGLVIVERTTKPRHLCRNFTVRNCVFDSNHRQGITVGSCENLLIENCIMRNSFGTAPQAGIDFEGDHSTARYVNCVLRNCLTEGNGGCGYSFYVASSDAQSDPVSITLEDCRSVGDAQGFNLGINHPPTKSYPRGYVRMDRCMFANTRGQAIWTETKCAGTPRLEMRDCIVTNAGIPALWGTLTWECEPPDGILLENLKIYLKRKGQDWLHYPHHPLTHRRVTDIRGNVLVVEPDGKKNNVVLDQAWCDLRFPPAMECPMPSREYPPESPDAYIVNDSNPGKRVKLPGNLVFGHIRYVFFADRPGGVSFAGYQRPWKPQGVIVKGHPDYMMKIGPYSADGKRLYGKDAIRVPVPGTNETVFTVNVPRRGLYQMLSRIWGSAFTLTEASVPVAVDMIGRPIGFKSIDGKPVMFYVPIDGRADSYILSAQLGGKNGAIAELYSPDGNKIAKSAPHCYWNVFQVPKGSVSGLWSLNFRAREGHPWQFNPRMDQTGAPLFFFLSPEKTFTFDSSMKGRKRNYVKVEVSE